MMPPLPPARIRLDEMLTKIKSNTYFLHNLDQPPLFKGWQYILINSLASGGETLKNFKKG